MKWNSRARCEKKEDGGAYRNTMESQKFCLEYFEHIPITRFWNKKWTNLEIELEISRDYF